MSKPTPGPWEQAFCGIVAGTGPTYETVCLEHDGFVGPRRIANETLTVAAVNACFAVSPDHPEAVAEAIPELLDALKVALAYMGKAEADGFCLDCVHPISKAIEKTRAALATALGGAGEAGKVTGREE